jgi:hypothetical protein
METAANDHDIVNGAAIDLSGATDHDNRFVRRLTLGECVIAENAKMDAVAPEAVAKLLHALLTHLATLVAPVLHSLAKLLTCLPHALALFLAAFGGIPAIVVVRRRVGFLRPGHRYGQQHEERGKSSSHGGLSSSPVQTEPRRAKFPSTIPTPPWRCPSHPRCTAMQPLFRRLGHEGHK